MARSRVNAVSSKPLSSFRSPSKKEWNEALLSKAPTKIAPQLQLWSMGSIQDALANVRALQAAFAWPSLMSAAPTPSPRASAASASSSVVFDEAFVFTHAHSCLLLLDPTAPPPSSTPLPSAAAAAAERTTAPTPPPTSPSFAPGDLVKVVGLSSAAGARYNGTAGIVQERSKSDPDDRVRVLLPDKVHYIRAANLIRSSSDAKIKPLTRDVAFDSGRGSFSSGGGNNHATGSGDAGGLQMLLAQVMHNYLIAHSHTSPSSSLREPTET
jgi:hypothetical protein